MSLGPPRVLLVCSAGGHLQQMLALKGSWDPCDRAWVCHHSPDSVYLLADENVVWAHGPTNRSVVSLLRNLRLAISVIRASRPDAILSTGAGVAVPFFLVGRLFGCSTVYVESLTRVSRLSLTGRLVYPFATHFFVQWPAAAGWRPRARFEGQLL